MLFFKGFLIGSAAILPGISGGVLCMSLGLYETLIESIIHFFQNPKKHLSFLIPFGISTVTGILIFSKILEIIYTNHTQLTCILFSILILTSIPSLLKEANIKINFMNTLCFLLTLSFSILLIAIKKQQLALLTLSTPTISQLMLIGFFTSAGIIIPGVSKSVILMIFGTYSLYLSAIASLNLTILIPIILGMALGSILFLKLIDFCFQHFKNYTYSTILGFVIGSIFILFV